MNYNTSFGFSDSPFLDVPDQRFFFLTEQHEKLLHELMAFVTTRQGVALISGDAGAGKTMLVQALIQRLPQSFEALVITKPASEPLAITMLLAQSLSLNLRERTLVNLTTLAEAVQAAAQQNRYFLVILENAHELTDRNLEEVYILSQMEYLGQQLIPFLLVGRKGLGQKIASKANQRLKELIRQDFALAGLNFEETLRYMDHRLQQVGSSFKACFAEGCSGQIFSRTGGIPRRINQVCDQALTRAWQENRSRVTRDLLGEEEPATPFRPLKPPSRRRFRKTSGGVLAGLLVLAGLAAFGLYNTFYRPSPRTLEPVAPTTASLEKSRQTFSPQKPAPEPLNIPQAQTREPAAEQTAGQEKPQPSPDKDSPGPRKSGESAVAAASPAPPPCEPALSGQEGSSPATYEVAPEDGLLRIVASHYRNEKDIGYDAVILANPRISNEDIIYPGQKLSLPVVDKISNVIKLNDNEYFGVFSRYYNHSQVEKTVARLKELQLRYLVRETRLPGDVTVYRIYLGGYGSREELQKAMLLAEQK